MLSHYWCLFYINCIYKNHCMSNVSAAQNAIKNFFPSFDRVWTANHEKRLFSFSKCFLQVEKYEILERCRFSRKTHLFRKVQSFMLCSFFRLLQLIFLDSASKTQSDQVVKSILAPKLYCWGRFESCRVPHV